jgi:hypothetical protein
MKTCRTRLALLMFSGLIFAGPAVAQTSSGTTAPPAHNVPTPPDADQSFLIGLRRVGVMAGQVVECSPGADKQAQISQAMELANQIAIHFGLRAAFNFVGALGYGSGHAFDKAGCSQAIDGWKQIEAKYLNK